MQKKIKEFYDEQMYTPNPDSTINILLYLLHHMPSSFFPYFKINKSVSFLLNTSTSYPYV